MTHLPGITHLQFVVLTALRAGDRPGRSIREELRRVGARRTAPAFYQMMARLEDAGLVTGWYEQRVLDGQILKERCYRTTPAGRRAWAETREFYRAAAQAEPKKGWTHA
jgi:DNA-binding PadR family transcriptional regulator